MCNPRKEWRRYLSVGGLMAQRPALGAVLSRETERDTERMIMAPLAPLIPVQHTKTRPPTVVEEARFAMGLSPVRRRTS